MAVRVRRAPWGVDGNFALVLGWMEEGEQPHKVELAPENPATKVLVEQW